MKYQKWDGASNNSFCCVPRWPVSGKWNSSVSFHTFPKDENQKKKWMHNVRQEGLVIKRSTTVCSRHFLPADIIQGGNRCLVAGALPVLFAWNKYSLPPVRSSVWERKPQPVEPEDDPEEEEMCPEQLLQCHDDDQRPEPSALNMVCEKIQAQQLVIEELQKRLAELSLQQTRCLA